MTTQPEMILFADSARGIYIPQHFAEAILREKVRGVSAEDWETLEAGPDAEWYWETWDEVLMDAVVIDDLGVKYTLYQDGDLWLIPDGMQYRDETETFDWPKDEQEDHQ